MKKILLDTDIGGDIDDAVCLAYLLREPQCELLGVSIVCGEPTRRAAVADAICKAAGRNLPIVAGEDKTLQPIPVYPTPDGAGALVRWPHDDFPRGDAPAFLYETLKKHPGEVTLIAVGNMTNVAQMFRRFPESMQLLGGLVQMNAYFGKEPLPSPQWNWNSWADPLATKEVMAAPLRHNRVVPADMTMQLTLAPEEAGRLFPDDRLCRAVLDFGGAWLKSSNQLTLHDPLAAVSVFHPEVCAYRRGRVDVETLREETMGATYFTPDATSPLEIAVSVDKERFYSILRETLHTQ